MSSSSSRALAALAVVFTAACSDDAVPVEEASRAAIIASVGCNAPTTPPKGLLAQQAASVKNNDRVYDLFVPDAHDGKHPLPLVFVFHDKGSNGAGIRQSLPVEGAAGGKALFVYPEVDATGDWDLLRGADRNIDIALFDSVRDSVAGTYCVDTNRVFVTGYEAGASFANQLACRRGSSIRAVASHAGTGPTGDLDEYGAEGLNCTQKPVAAIVTHGVDDALVPLAEGQKTRDHWSRVNSCKTGGAEPFDPAPCTSLAGCARDRPVVYCEVPALGHAVWTDAARATWTFFDSL